MSKISKTLKETLDDEFLEAARKGIPLSDYRAERLALIEEENERLKAAIYDLKNLYYQPRPEGSVTVTHTEYDALLNIYMTAQSMLVLGVSDAALRTLAMQVDSYTEMLETTE